VRIPNQGWDLAAVAPCRATVGAISHQHSAEPVNSRQHLGTPRPDLRLRPGRPEPGHVARSTHCWCDVAPTLGETGDFAPTVRADRAGASGDRARHPHRVAGSAELADAQHVDTRQDGVRRYLCDRGISTRVVDAIRQRLVDQSSSDVTRSTGV